MIALVVAGRNEKEIILGVQESSKADLIELRLDYLQDLKSLNLEKIISKCKIPVIVTIRTKKEGGFFDGNDRDRMEVFNKAINVQAGYIDVEFSSSRNIIDKLVRQRNKTRIIISYHNFRKTPNNLFEIYDKIKLLNPDMTKIVTRAKSVSDNFKTFELIKQANKEKKKIIAFCMGELGQFSRIMGKILGSKIAYASLQKDKESAPGQMSLKELNEIYRIKKLDKNTKIFGLIGNPVEHSFSHVVHNAAFENSDMDAVYLKFDVDKLKEFVSNIKKHNMGGFSVTIPHKVGIMKYLDRIDKKAREIGAVNTITIESKRLHGYNTDCDGAMQALEGKADLDGKNTIILGAGGSARAIAYGLLNRNAKITVLGRAIEKTKKMADGFGCNFDSLENIGKYDYDILINTTPVGMHPLVNKIPIPQKNVRSGTIVMDIIFNPRETKLLKEAKKRKCETINGTEMFLNQAFLQFKLWTGKKAPEELMRKKLAEAM